MTGRKRIEDGAEQQAAPDLKNSQESVEQAGEPPVRGTQDGTVEKAVAKAADDAEKGVEPEAKPPSEAAIRRAAKASNPPRPDRKVTRIEGDLIHREAPPKVEADTPEGMTAEAGSAGANDGAESDTA
jgi:hypothetical protein